MKYHLLIWTILLFNLNVVAQSVKQLKKKAEMREVVLYIGEAMIRANVWEHGKKIEPDIQLRYSWFKNNMILTTRGGYDGKLLHGAYAEFYPNRNLKVQGCYKTGLYHGRWKEWYPNGELKKITPWKNGYKHGKLFEFSELGAQQLYAVYKKDRLKKEKHWADKPMPETEPSVKKNKANKAIKEKPTKEQTDSEPERIEKEKAERKEKNKPQKESTKPEKLKEEKPKKEQEIKERKERRKE